MKTRPSPWRVSDALKFLLPAAVPMFLAFLYWPELSGQARALLLVVSASFAALWVFIVKQRAELLDSFPMMTKHGVLVQRNGYNVTLSALEARIDRLIKQYETVQPGAGNAILRDYVWVTFVPGTIPHPRAPGKMLAGFVPAGGRHIKVGFFNPVTREPDPKAPLENTAFDHELGHIFLGYILDTWDEETHHRTMRQYGLR